MSRFLVGLAFALALLASSSFTSAEVIEHSFHVKNLTVTRLCRRQVITTVNGSLPGPAIRVREGDTVVVHVYNDSPYNISIHWHGVQFLNCWADGADYITHCPIRPKHSYTYKLKIIKQEGTFWWQAHSSWLRATVHGAFIVHPRKDHSYPFPKPYEEVPIILGAWWNGNVVDIVNSAVATGATPNSSDAFTINGQPGDLYPCSREHTYKLKVIQGKTYLLRIINAALNSQLFFKIANHKLTVVAVDASYTNPYVTDVVLIAPGQTTDILVTADQTPGAYYMAALPYISIPNATFDNHPTTGILFYENAPSTTKTPVMPQLPAFNDTPTAYRFNSNITALVGAPHWVPVPPHVDEHMFVTIGFGLAPCPQNTTCGGPTGQKFSASMNNASFQFPTKLSLLQAFFFNVSGIYTADFPNKPPVKFDYTNPNNSLNQALLFAPKRTSLKKVKFNATIEIIFQGTSLIGVESHPIHTHGFSFHVLAQDFGNFNPSVDRKKFNLVNPQIRNTISVPVGGWAAIRLTTNNPGVWIMHCPLEAHLPWGLGTAFAVENGPTASSTLPPPPEDLPHC